VSLLESVTATLPARGACFALIGAGAMAVHGVSRATRGLDILVTDAACLRAAPWVDVERELPALSEHAHQLCRIRG